MAHSSTDNEQKHDQELKAAFGNHPGYSLNPPMAGLASAAASNLSDEDLNAARKVARSLEGDIDKSPVSSLPEVGENSRAKKK